MAIAEVELDVERVEAFAQKLMTMLNNALTVTSMSIGHRAGLFDAMTRLPRPATSGEIAAAAGLEERYVREWLAVMVTSGVVEYHAHEGAYRLPPEHAALSTRAAGPDNFAAYTQIVSVLSSVEDDQVEKFRHGGGEPWGAYNRVHELMRELSGAVFDAQLVEQILPLVPGVIERLERGIDVADVGTGCGRAVNLMGRAFPNSRFVGFDFSESALATARSEAASWGLGNVKFEARDAARLDCESAFDLITTFDAVHDQADPEAVVAGVFRALRPGGDWLCSDIRASSHLGENLDHPLGPFLYGISCQICMTVSLADGGAGLGTMWGVQKAREIFARAGFGGVVINTLPGNVMENYYVCRKA